ncbi:hypothetical protein D9M71_208960 [compost metagenome]
MLACFALDPHLAAGRRGIAGVGQQVDQYLGQALRVTLDPVIGVAQVEKLHFEVAPVQCQQADGILRHFGQAHRFVGLLMAAGMGETHQRLDDTRDALGLFEYLAAQFGNLAIFLTFFTQVLRKAGDTSNGVADFVGHPGGETPDTGKALGMNQFIFEHLGFCQIFDQHHQATIPWSQRLVDGRLVQVEPASLTIQAQALLV